mgnify:CR=1 FL=1
MNILEGNERAERPKVQNCRHKIHGTSAFPQAQVSFFLDDSQTGLRVEIQQILPREESQVCPIVNASIAVRPPAHEKQME